MQINEFINHMGLKIPIIQAPMAGGATTPELVAAVANAGGLGSLGAGYMPAQDIKKACQKIRMLTDKPFAINLFIPESHHANVEKITQMCGWIQQSCAELNLKIDPPAPPYSPSFDEQMQVILEEKIPIFSFTFGIPSDVWLRKLKNNKIFIIGTATTLAEAQLLEQKGIDAIVAQGSEAGGHRGTFLGAVKDALIETMSLVPQLIDNIKIPVIAAGGIMDGRGIIAAMNLGALAVQMGSAFLTCHESGINKKYKEKLLQTTQNNTTLTHVFSGRYARGIKNKFIERMQPYAENILAYPIQNALTRSMRKEADKQNNIEFMSMWVGQNAHLCEDLSAGELVKRLADEMVHSDYQCPPSN